MNGERDHQVVVARRLQLLEVPRQPKVLLALQCTHILSPIDSLILERFHVVASLLYEICAAVL